MGTFYFLLLIIIALVGYAVSSICGKEVVRGVEAGPVGECDPKVVRERSFRARPIEVRDEKGSLIDTSNMIRVVVCGDCMSHRNIPNNSQLLVKKIDKTKPLEEQIKHDDIVMIHLKDQNLDKIRIFDKFDEYHQLLTYRYSGDVRVNSSFPHTKESVLGVVKYKL